MVAGERGAVFAHYLTDAGQAELYSLLDSGGYRLEFPEQAALLAVAWLLRAGDRARALGVLDEIGPYADRLCFVPAPAGWHERADMLLARYEALAAVHTRCGKHRNPKENLAILRAAAQVVTGGGELAPRQRGMLRHAVGSMVARRGRPGSPEHAVLRVAQARDAAIPGHHQLARVVVTRVAACSSRSAWAR